MALHGRGSGLDASLRAGRNWFQSYDPMQRWWLSALCAALPLITLFVLMAGLRIRAHLAALVSLVLALLTAMILFHMPVALAWPAALMVPRTEYSQSFGSCSLSCLSTSSL